MTSADLSADPARPLRTLTQTLDVLLEDLGPTACSGAAALHMDDGNPMLAARMTSLAAARTTAAALGLSWHSQATRTGQGTYVHAFEGVHDGYPLTVYAFGEHDPGAATLNGAVALSVLLGGLVL